jgi:hypothetical protein
MVSDGGEVQPACAHLPQGLFGSPEAIRVAGMIMQIAVEQA